MSSIRFGLQRHFISVRNVDILKSGEFSRSNRAFKAKISKLKSIGKAEVKHYPPITDDDVNKINEHLVFSAEHSWDSLHVWQRAQILGRDIIPDKTKLQNLAHQNKLLRSYKC